MLDNERIKLLAKLNSMNEADKLKLLAQLQEENKKLKKKNSDLETTLIEKLTQELDRKMKDES